MLSGTTVKSAGWTLVALALVNASAHAAPPPDALGARREAVKLARAGHFAEARVALDRGVALAPDWAELYFLRAGVAVSLAGPEADLERLAARARELTAARNRLADRVGALGDRGHEPTVSDVEAIYRSAPSWQGEALEALLAAAVADLEHYRRLAPGAPDDALVSAAVTRLGALLQAAGQVDLALTGLIADRSAWLEEAVIAADRRDAEWRARRDAAESARTWSWIGLGLGVFAGGGLCAWFVTDDSTGAAAASCTLAISASILGLIGVASNPTPAPL